MILTANPSKVSIYDNRKTRYKATQVKAITGADIVFNGSLFNWSDYSPCCDIRVGGKTLNDDQWGYYGYGWNDNELPKVMHSKDMFAVDNYLSCIWAIHNGEKQTLNDNQSGIGGVRGRTAFGFKGDGTMVIIVTSDSNGAMTLSQTRDTLYDGGCVSGIILDGGGSSQIDTDGTDIRSLRIVSNFVCVWLAETPTARPPTTEKESTKKMKVCLDPGHGTREMNQSPDGRYIEYKFALDMAFRIREHLIRCGVDVKLTKEDSSTPSLTERANIANAFKADLFVSLHSNAIGGSGWNDNTRGLCVYTYASGGERHRAANILIDEMAKAGVQMFGSKLFHNTFAVLKYTNMPAYLIEYAFHTSRPDVELLLNNAHRDKLALATAKAICVFGGVKWIDAPTAPTKPAGEFIYRVQVGAFSVEENATKLKAELESKGYKPFVVKERKA